MNPSFSGEASENTEVVVHVFLGTEEVASAKTTAASGKWSTSGLSKALPSGKNTFKAFANEKSGLGNAEGKSNEVSFEVNTLPPEVKFTEVPPLISNNTTPAFAGTASETAAVTIEVFKGEKAEGKPVATLTAPVSGEHWGAAHITKELENGKYTAVASEPSSLEGNPVGHSSPYTFEVDTSAPTVIMTPPASPTKNTKPSFSGTVSGPAGPTVTVLIYEGVSVQGKIVRTVSAPITKGSWATGPVEPPLPAGRHKFTAVATASSSIGNGTGRAPRRRSK